MTKQLRYLCTLLLCLIASVGWVKAEDLTSIDFTLSNTTITFSSFENAGSYNENSESFLVVGSDNNSYTWTKVNCMKGSSTNSLQMKKETGSATSPTIKSNSGFTVNITFNATAKGNLQLQIGQETTVVKTGVQNSSGANQDVVLSASTTATETTFTLSNIKSGSNSAAVYVTKIEIVPASNKTEAGLSFGETTSYTATLGDAFTAPTLINPNGLEVSYTSSNPEYATVNSETGKVNLVSAGTTTITASSEETDTYLAGLANYTLTVNKASVAGQLFYESFNKFAGTGGNDNSWSGSIASAAWGETDNEGWTVENAYSAKECAKFGTSSKLGKATTPAISNLNGNATLTFKAAAWSTNSEATTLKLSITGGGNLSESSVTMAKGSWNEFTISIIGGTPETKITFAGNAANSSRFFLDEILIVKAPAATVETPTFSLASNTYFEAQSVEISCETDGAKIYYTLDGTDPTAESTEYTEPISISETTTLKAIAVKGEDESAVASATYTFPDTYTTIAAFKEANTTACLNLTGAQVVYVDANKKNIYVRDNSGAICLYSGSTAFETELKEGDILSGTIYGKYALYNNLPEVTEIQNFDKLAVTDNNAVTPKNVSNAAEIAANMCDLVKITKTQITETDSKFYVLGVQLYDKLKLGYTPETGVDASITGVVTDFNKTTEIFPRTAGDIVYYPAAPTFSLAAGEVEKGTEVTITAEKGATLKYTVGETTTTTESNTSTVTVNEDVTIKAVAVKDGLESEEVSAAYTVKAEEPVEEPGTPVEITEGFYTIKNNGNEKFVNVAGRKTVTFVDEATTATAPGTVIKVSSNADGQVQILRSQGVDIPGYAQKAMNYVPEIVQLVVEKLNNLDPDQQIMGENGMQALLNAFNEGFDYHLYTEQAEGGIRIYGKTPSMEKVVKFYEANTANVDAKLPMLESLINKAIDKVLEKTGGSGASILKHFSLAEIWTLMGSPSDIAQPTEDTETQKAFLQWVLRDKTRVWNFAYQTAMIYWKPLINHDKVQQNLSQLGDLAQYVTKIENIQPESKYYIVQNEGKLDVFNVSNIMITEDDARTIWTLSEPRTEFKVNFNEENTLNGKYYTTLYTDFAYTLPEGVKAMTVTKVSELNGKSIAITEAIEGAVPAQTPVLLESESADAQTLTLSIEDGAAPTDNLLKGPDYLINEYGIKTAQVQDLFLMVKDILGETFYQNYIEKYEHLTARNAGTVNNKYFFGLDDADIELCTYDSGNSCVVRNLSTGDEELGFYDNWTVDANKAFLVSETNPVKLWLKGDVDRDGDVDYDDVKALVKIVLGEVTEGNNPNNYDFDAAKVNEDTEINIADVTALVNILK